MTKYIVVKVRKTNSEKKDTKRNYNLRIQISFSDELIPTTTKK